MADINQVQLPDGSQYNIKDTMSGYATTTYVQDQISAITKATIGLGNVDNTSDMNKPVSTAQQTAIDAKANNSTIAYTESSTTATKRYEIGDHFILGGTLYTVTAIIPNGGAITVGTNCEVADSVEEQMETMSNVIDTKTDQSLIATVQTTLTASRAYAVNDEFVYNGLLYKFTTSCAQGGTITIGGNCTLADSVTSQIKGLVKYADQTLTFTNGSREVTNVSTTWGLSNVNLFINFHSLTRGYNITWSYYGGKLYMIVSNATSYTGDLSIRVIYV